MTAAVLIAFAGGCAFVTVCVGFVLVINNAAQAAADYADRKAAARDAASTFCAAYIPDSSEVQATIARIEAGDERVTLPPTGRVL